MGWVRAPVWWPVLAIGVFVAAGVVVLMLRPDAGPSAILIESAGERATPIAPSASPTPTVDLNRASRAELMALPGIGEGRADAILAARDLRAFESLLDVAERGILSVDVLQRLAGWVGVRP